MQRIACLILLTLTGCRCNDSVERVCCGIEFKTVRVGDYTVYTEPSRGSGAELPNRGRTAIDGGALQLRDRLPHIASSAHGAGLR